MRITENTMKAVQYLSPAVKDALRSVLGVLRTPLCEIRLRKSLPLCFCTYNGRIFVNDRFEVCRIENAMSCTGSDVEYTVDRLCGGSLYRYTDTLKKGYIVTSDGIRAGIYGEAVYENGRLSVVDGFSGVNLRIPHRHRSAGEMLYAKYFRDGLHSLLIYSPPGVGKTTLIREAAIRLSKKYTVAVIDEKGEIFPSESEKECGMCDILRGYSKPEGMEIAVRTLSPMIIICDEIGMTEDIPSILSVQNSGVPLIATAHADSLSAVMAKPNLRSLCENGVFERFVRLSRSGNGAETTEELMSGCAV